MWKRNFESETKNLKTTKIKNLVDGFDIELDASEERIGELRYRSEVAYLKQKSTKNR